MDTHGTIYSHTGCRVNIYEEIELLRTIVINVNSSQEEKESAQQKLDILELIYC